MQKIKQIPYKIRRILPALGMAGATLFASCERDDPITPPEPIVPTTDIELTFSATNYQKNICTDTLRKYIARPDVRHIYMIPKGYWTHYEGKGLTNLRHQLLEILINMSPKVHGRGDFYCKTGVPSTVPEDSLWYVENGWTINAHLIPKNQNQR